MLIRIKQARVRPDPKNPSNMKYGTDIEFGRKGTPTYRVYHFRPADQKHPGENHVCDIDSKEDIATLLAIKEGYEIDDSEMTKKKPAAEKGEDKGGASKGDAEKKDGQGAGASTTPKVLKPYGSMNKPELLKLVAERTGEQPHGTTSKAKLIETLEAIDKAAK